MKKIGLSLLVFLLGSTLAVQAQNDADALRYSMLNYGSTARSLGMSNSFGALGADFSCLAINPAGIAFYRRSEVTFSPLFSNRNTSSTYLGNSNEDNYFKFAFGNFGAVFSSTKDHSNSEWKGWNFGIGYNKLNDFNSRSVAQGVNNQNSLLDNYLEQLDGVAPDDIPSSFPYDVDLAWQTYLIDTITLNGGLYYYNQIPYAGALQKRTVETKGGQGEWDFSLGTNYDNKLYMGVTLGISSLRYEQEVLWEEKDVMDTIPGFTSYKLTENLKTTGTGFNVKFGMIYKPNDFVRIGAAIHTPTYLSLRDNYRTSIRTKLDNTSESTYSGPDFIPFDYEINTPFRAIGSLAFILGKVVALNVDYEYLNYSQARTRSADPQFSDYFSDINSAIRAKYTESHNIRIGGEYRYEILRFRLGVQSSTTPFKNKYTTDSNTDLSRKGYSAGFGIKQDKFFIDFAYAHTESGSFLQPYTLSNQEVQGIKYKQKDNRFLFTVGFTF
ncbi:hemin receptor [soil metagenome]